MLTRDETTILLQVLEEVAIKGKSARTIGRIQDKLENSLNDVEVKKAAIKEVKKEG